MPDAEANRSLFWWLHQVKWEFFLRSSDLDVAMEPSNDALKSVLVPNPFVRIGRVVTLDSFADSLRWAARFLYHLMPKNMRQDISIPSAKPTETPRITKSVWRTILWSLLILKQWNHFAEEWYCRGPLSRSWHNFMLIHRSKWHQLNSKIVIYPNIVLLYAPFDNRGDKRLFKPMTQMQQHLQTFRCWTHGCKFIIQLQKAKNWMPVKYSYYYQYWNT